jgi:hypothetical protein
MVAYFSGGSVTKKKVFIVLTPAGHESGLGVSWIPQRSHCQVEFLFLV